ncbi:MAG: hypothetical protein LBH58_13735 [Tannerellaceae bacterium]|jgi:hypothetical protein|nr:hypothetical protein [Tannerellaceae bacterium]
MKRKIRHENRAKLKAGKYSLFLLFFSFSILNGLQAQVTIGSSNIPPAEGVLLDLKEHEADNDGATSNKGVLFPRVALTGLDSLDPLVKDAIPAEKIKHRGTVVYNMTVSPQNNLREGFYYWNGNKWVFAQDDTDAWNTTGNAGTNPATNYLGTSDNQPLVLKANKQEGLRISTNGELYIADAKEIADAKVLVRDNQGKVGLAGVIPAKVMLIQSEDIQEYSVAQAPNFNQGGTENAIVVTWKAADLVMNNAVDDEIRSSVGTFEEFTVKEDGIYELSGFILYDPCCRLPSVNTTNLKTAVDSIKSARAAVNVAIQLKKTGETKWNNIAAARQIWAMRAVGYVISQVTIPPTAKPLEAGDKLRMVFYRPTAGWGLPHGGADSFGISSAYGLDVKKGLKITIIN